MFINLDKLIENTEAINKEAINLGFNNLRLCKPIKDDEHIAFLVEMDAKKSPTFIEKDKLRIYFAERLELPASSISIFTEDSVRSEGLSAFYKSLYQPLLEFNLSLSDIPSHKSLVAEWYNTETPAPIKTSDESKPVTDFYKVKKKRERDVDESHDKEYEADDLPLEVDKTHRDSSSTKINPP